MQPHFLEARTLLELPPTALLKIQLQLFSQPSIHPSVGQSGDKVARQDLADETITSKMNFFDRPGRGKIALGGTSRTATSEQLLARARKAREERRHRRLQHEAATQLESMYRRRCAILENVPLEGDVAERLIYASGLWECASLEENLKRVRESVERRQLGDLVREVRGGDGRVLALVLEWCRREGEWHKGWEEIEGSGSIEWGVGEFVGRVVRERGEREVLQGIERVVERILKDEEMYAQIAGGVWKVEGVLEKCVWTGEKQFVERGIEALGKNGVEDMSIEEATIVLENVLEVGGEGWGFVRLIGGLIERLGKGGEEWLDKVWQGLKRVVSEDVIRKWMKAGIEEGHVGRVCQLLDFMCREREMERMVNNALAFWRGSEHVLKVLWRGEGRMRNVFARAYAHLLYVQDADEMFERNWPFSVEEVREMVGVLKQYLFNALYGRGEREDVVEVARLLKRLHACDEKRPFRTGEDFWIAGKGVLNSTAFLENAREAGPGSLRGGGREVARNKREGAVMGAGELLRVAPFLVPFSVRAKLFHVWVGEERDRANGGEFMHHTARTVQVRRKWVFDDAFQELNGLGEDLKATIRVKFIDEHGLEEAGIDGGGVFKEFMYEVLKQGFSPFSYALFKETGMGRLYPSPDAVAMEGFETQYAFLGRMLGKAVFDGVLVDIPLAGFFVRKMVGEVNYPADLKSLDPVLHRNMKMLKNYPPELVEELGLNFTVVNNAFGSVQEVELVKDGKQMAVTGENRIEYMHRVANYRMNTQIREQTDAFVKGFSELVAPEYVRLFSHEELQLLISGKGGKIDLDDLRRHTKYSGGYNEDTMVIKWFWQALHELSAEDQSKMLQFVTSSPRAPLLGFSYLVPSFCIHRAEGDVRLPTASTCMNLLKLPEYKSLQVVRDKLQYALKSNAGFDLS